MHTPPVNFVAFISQMYTMTIKQIAPRNLSQQSYWLPPKTTSVPPKVHSLQLCTVTFQVIIGRQNRLPDITVDRKQRTPIGNRRIRAVHLSRQASHTVTGSIHLRCKPQQTGARESPSMASERPRPKESQSPELWRLNSVSTDNPMDGVHPSSPRKPLPHLGRPEATPEMWKPSKPTPLTADKVNPLWRTATNGNSHNPYEP